MNRCVWLSAQNLVLSLLVFLPVTGVPGAETRYDDVVYFADFNHPPLLLKVLRQTVVIFPRNSKKVVANLAAGKSVSVIGLGETQYFIEVRKTFGNVQGWVDVSALTAPPAAIGEELRRLRDRAEAHRALIERREVVVGMTKAEVRASLGEPEHTERIQLPSGVEERWSYTAYKYTPHYVRAVKETSQFSQKLSYGRVPSGHKMITFRQEEVAEIADDNLTEAGSPENAAAAKNAP